MQIQKSFMYWVKVVSLGVILGVGLQVAQAWVAPTAVPPNGNIGLRKFVSDCNQFAVNGWSDKQECLHDGRLHLVQSTMGKANQDVIDAVKAGAYASVTYSFSSGAFTSKECTAFSYRSADGNALCIEAARYGGSTMDNNPDSLHFGFNASNPQPDRTWGSLQTYAIRSDGKTRGVSIIPRSDGQTSYTYMMATGGAVSNLKWYVHY